MHLDGMKLDRDPALLFEVHVVEDLVELHLAGRDRAGPLQKAVGDRRFAVINMGYDAEIPDRAHAVSSITENPSRGKRGGLARSGTRHAEIYVFRR
jgi:hypothetical protein